jgi:hypothetical protein
MYEITLLFTKIPNTKKAELRNAVSSVTGYSKLLLMEFGEIPLS